MTLWQGISAGDYSLGFEECFPTISYGCPVHGGQAYLCFHYFSDLFHLSFHPFYPVNSLFQPRRREPHHFPEHRKRSLGLAEHFPNLAHSGQFLHNIPQGLGNINNVSGNYEKARCNGEYAMRTGKQY